MPEGLRSGHNSYCSRPETRGYRRFIYQFVTGATYESAIPELRSEPHDIEVCCEYSENVWIVPRRDVHVAKEDDLEHRKIETAT